MLDSSAPKRGPKIKEKQIAKETQEKFLLRFVASDISEIIALMGVDVPPVIPAINLPKRIK